MVKPEAIRILKDLCDEEYRKLYRWSANYTMTEPQKGYEEDWKKHRDRLTVLEQVIETFE